MCEGGLVCVCVCVGGGRMGVPSEFWWMRMCGSMCVDVQNVSIGVCACAIVCVERTC